MCWRSSKPSVHLMYLLLFWLFAFSIISPPGYGQGREISVTTGGPRFLDTPPGRTLTVAFVVANRTEETLQLIEGLDLPEGWQKIIPLSSFRLPPGGRTTRILAFHISPSTPAGEYEIEYKVRERERYSLRDGERVRIKVLPVEDVSLMLEKKPFNVIAGESYEILARLVNGGNSSDTYRIKAESSEESSVKLNPSEVSLDAGQSQIITLEVNTDPYLDTTREYLTMRVYSSKEPGEPVDILGVGIDIIGEIDIRADPYHSIPTTLSLFLGGDNTDNGDEDYYLEWSGYGSIDEEETKFIDFMFRGPDNRDGGYFSQRDEYYLNYYQPDLDILLGDQGYELSDLTARYTYGRGYGVNYRPGGGDLEVGGHYVEDRDEAWDEQKGFHASYRVRNDLDLRLNFLDKRDLENSRHVRDKIWSLEANYELGRYGQLLVEYGISDSTREKSEKDDAYLLEFDSNYFEDVSLYYSLIHAGIDYEGYYSGYDYNSAYIGFPLGNRLRMSLSYMDYKDLIDPDASSTAFYTETAWQAYLDYSLSNGWYLNAGYETFDRYDQLEPREEDISVNSIWFGIGRSMEIWSYNLEVRRGEKEDFLNDETSRGWNYGIYITHRPSESLFFTLFGEFGDEETSGIRGMSSSNRAGFSVSWQIRRNWLFNFWYRRSGFGSDEDTEEDEFELESFYTFRNGHSLGLLVRHLMEEDNEDETEYQLIYSIPIKIRTELKKDLGTIEGRIYDAQLEDNPGIPGAILRCQGKTTVTDEDGAFILSPLLPGKHILHLDRQSIGWERVPNVPSPVVADINGMGEITNMEVGVVDSCVISGKITAMVSQKEGIVASDNSGKKELSLIGGNKDEDQSVSKKLPSVLVELKAGDNMIRKITDPEGEFIFENLYPAEWVLTVYEESLPPYTRIDKEQEVINVEAGQKVNVNRKLLPKVRNIQMLAEGEKITSETSGN